MIRLPLLSFVLVRISKFEDSPPLNDNPSGDQAAHRHNQSPTLLPAS